MVRAKDERNGKLLDKNCVLLPVSQQIPEDLGTLQVTFISIACSDGLRAKPCEAPLFTLNKYFIGTELCSGFCSPGKCLSTFNKSLS